MGTGGEGEQWVFMLRDGCRPSGGLWSKGGFRCPKNRATPGSEGAGCSFASLGEYIVQELMLLQGWKEYVSSSS